MQCNSPAVATTIAPAVAAAVVGIAGVVTTTIIAPALIATPAVIVTAACGPVVAALSAVGLTAVVIAPGPGASAQGSCGGAGLGLVLGHSTHHGDAAALQLLQGGAAGSREQARG